MTEFHAIAVAIREAWADAFAAADYGRLAALYAPRVQFWGSTATLHTDPAGVRAYFDGLPAGYREARFGTPDVLALAPEVFTASGEVVFVRAEGGAALELLYRMTHVLVRLDAGWRIAVHHASPRP